MRSYKALFIFFLRAGHQVQQNLAIFASEALSRKYRLALLPWRDALGNAIDEQIRDVIAALGRKLTRLGYLSCKTEYTVSSKL